MTNTNASISPFELQLTPNLLLTNVTRQDKLRIWLDFGWHQLYQYGKDAEGAACCGQAFMPCGQRVTLPLVSTSFPGYPGGAFA